MFLFVFLDQPKHVETHLLQAAPPLSPADPNSHQVEFEEDDWNLSSNNLDLPRGLHQNCHWPENDHFILTNTVGHPTWSAGKSCVHDELSFS